MKKFIISSLLTGLLFANYGVDIKEGWNNIGFSTEYNIKKIADSEQFDYVWYFDPIEKKWKFYSPDEALMNLAQNNNIEVIPDLLPDGSGVWIFSEKNTTISSDVYENINDFSTYYTTYYNNIKYAIGIKDGNVYFAKASSDSSEWDTLILLENDVSSLNSAFVYVGENENDVIFSYTIRNDNNVSAYVGTFDGENISKQLVKEITNGDIYPYYGGVFTDPVNNSIQYILFQSYFWNEYNKGDLTIAINGDKNEWNFETIENITPYDIEVNYDYVYRENAEPLKKLNSFSLTTVNPLKTLFYSVENGSINKTLELDTLWRSMTYFENEGVTYSLYTKTYNRSYAQGKHLALIKNNSEVVNINDFDHFIVAVGMLNSDEFYAFGHDEIGGNLYIYKTTDGGKSWSLFKEVENFNYQINYVSSLYRGSDGEIYCKMRVNRYSFDIESKDTFNTWQIVTTDYKINNQVDSKYIERVEKDGSITILGEKQ